MGKVVLVVYLLLSRNQVMVQYTTKYESEKECMTVAATMKDRPNDIFRTYPITEAVCTFDIKREGK